MSRPRSRTDTTIADQRALERELRTIRAQGIALYGEDHLRGYAALAAPVAGRKGGAIASITVPAPAALLDVETVEPLLRRTAHVASLTVCSASRITPRVLRR